MITAQYDAETWCALGESQAERYPVDDRHWCANARPDWGERGYSGTVPSLAQGITPHLAVSCGHISSPERTNVACWSNSDIHAV